MMPILTIVFTSLLIISTVIAFKPSTIQNKLCNSRSIFRTKLNSIESISIYEELQIPTLLGIYLVDITPDIKRIVLSSGVKEGVVTILSRHTTTAITINEMEGRLVDDTRQFLLKLVPAAYPYLHNDLHLRDGPSGWPGGNEAWRAQEPINAHSHLIMMLLGASESVPIHESELMLGKWQSIIMAELDGPRTRSIAVQVTGIKETK
mmetsp:Transcript_10347/g.9975  ORF Transcript_10347/g.9975 Transcript_10347/m.9975 type:complete len:206 (-) Transcript_10347:104-721(-)